MAAFSSPFPPPSFLQQCGILGIWPLHRHRMKQLFFVLEQSTSLPSVFYPYSGINWMEIYMDIISIYSAPSKWI